MLITTTLFFASLSPDVRKQSFIESFGGELSYHIEQVDTNLVKESVYLIDSESSKLNSLIGIVYDENKNIQVVNNTIHLLKNIPSLFLMNFKEDDLYKSSYGTMILEFTKSDDSLFTIDIGEKSFGYFSEVNGKIKHLVEELDFSGNEIDIKNVIGKLNKDFLEFFSS